MSGFIADDAVENCLKLYALGLSGKHLKAILDGFHLKQVAQDCKFGIHYIYNIFCLMALCFIKDTNLLFCTESSAPFW